MPSSFCVNWCMASCIILSPGFCQASFSNMTCASIKAVATAYFGHGTISVFFWKTVNNDSSIDVPRRTTSFGLFSKKILEDDFVNQIEIGDLVDPVLAILMDNPAWKLKVFQDKAAEILPWNQKKNYPEEAVLIFGENILQIEQFCKLIAAFNIFGPKTKLMIMITSANVSEIGEILSFVNKRLRAINAYVLLVHPQSVKFYTRTDPLATNNEATLVNSYTDHFENKKHLFPDRITPNLHRFTLELLYLNPDANLIKKRQQPWPELRNVRAIAKSLKTPLREQILFENLDEQYKIWNRTSKKIVGFVGTLHRHDADIACGSSLVLTNAVTIACDFLPPYGNFSLSWHLKKPKPVKGVMALVVQFSPNVWGCFILTWISIAATIILQNWVNKVRMDTSQVLLILYGLNLENAPAGQRFFRCTWWIILLYSIVMTSAYKSGLTTNLTRPPKERQVESFEEAVSLGYTVGMYDVVGDGHLPHWMGTNAALDKAVASKKVKFFHDSMYQAMFSHPAGMIALENAHNSQIVTIRFFTNFGRYDEFDVLPKTFQSFPQSVLMSPGHPLLPKFAEKQLLIFQSGLLRHWQKEFWHILKITSDRKPSDPSHVAISVYNLRGLLFLFVVGIFFSFVCFLFELALRHCVIEIKCLRPAET